ncbi:MAG: hypothetical protein IIB15_01525 [Chloroflexi bacterium]|nr:hypothetical protein [Chloroflexota bacterium]
MSACKDGIYAAYHSLTMSEKRLGSRWNAVARESSEENILTVVAAPNNVVRLIRNDDSDPARHGWSDHHFRVVDVVKVIT